MVTQTFLSYWKKAAALTLCLFLASALVIPSFVYAEGKVVRVGWYDSQFNYSDRFGRRSGYAYEYQQKIAAYTGWTYEYVEASWPDLFDMLKKGEIDLLSDVSYTKEREGTMLFTSLPMGVETYYLYVPVDNKDIRMEDPASLNGKKIGVNRNSYQRGLLIEWAKRNAIDLEVVDLSNTDHDAVEMLKNGGIDAFVAIDAHEDERVYVPLFKMGYSEFFFAVSKSRPDLLGELNVAMSKLQDENRFFDQQMHEKYFVGPAAFLSPSEADWLAHHGTIRVGYSDDYPPFCGTDPKTEQLQGALKDYLELASTCTKNAKIDFEAVPYKTFDAALDALRAGSVDCVFPISISAYDGEKLGVLVTAPIMRTEMYAVMRKSIPLGDLREREMTVAVNAGNPNYEMFFHEYFPDWKSASYGKTEECFRAVESGAADCALVNNYRVVQTDALRNRHHLTARTTGATMNFSFAVRRGDGVLYSILNKTARLVPAAAIDSALTAYAYPEEKFSFTDFLKEHLAMVIAALLAIAILVILLLIRRTKRKAQTLEERLALQNRLLEQERQAHRSDGMITAMAADYRSVFYIDLDKDEGICYRATTELQNGIKEGDSFPFKQTLLQYANDCVAESERTNFLQFAEPDNIRAGLANEPMIAHRYLAVKDGKEYYEMLRIVDVHQAEDCEDHTVHAICAGFSDVDSETREEMAQKRTLSDALNQAEAANIAKTSFLSSMSHEIRTPMNAIIGLNAIALKDADLPPRTRDYLEKIGTSANHLMELINGILDMSRIESGRMTIRNEEFSFRAMLEQINTMIHGQCQNKGLQYDCQLMGQVDDYYLGDDMKLKQIIINILGNAVKYTPAPGTVSFIVEPLTQYEGNAPMRFIMKDTGIGIDADFLPKIFEPFSQEDENKSNKYGSTGLGMAITRNIVEMMNGKIEVESEKGAGSTFTVTIPLKTTDRTDHIGADDVRPQDLHVLIIDDDPGSCKHSQFVLDLAGIAADVCNSGKEAYEMIALAQARQQPYNLILVDWKMPEQDGLEVTRTIREKYDKPSAIIILTAYSWDEIRDEALAAGVDSFIAKPLFASGVMQEFKQALQRKDAVKKEPPRANLAGKRVLLAEDMLVNAEIMKEILRMREMEVEHAENGQIAADMFAEHPEGYYNAILMDVRMPVMDGLRATETIRAMDRPDAKTIPIIAMTANAFDEDVQRSLQAGMNAHLSKPVEMEKLFETLETLIRED